MEAKRQKGGWKQPPEFPQLCRFLAERSPQPMVAVEGLTHIVRYANPAFRKLLGKVDQHLIGRPFAEAVPEGMANGCAPLLDRVFATGMPEAIVEQEHGPGAVGGTGKGRALPTHWSYWVWAILGPGRDPAGGADEIPLGVMIQVTDATEVAAFRKAAAAINEALLVSGVRQHELMGEAEKLSAELRRSEAHEREAKQQAEAANRAKDLFLATLSHELRTPLSAIVGWVSLLRRKGRTDEDLHEGLEVIERNTKAQAQLIEDVLDVSRIVSGKLRLDVKPCDLAGVIRAAMDVVRVAADAKGVDLQAKLDPATVLVSCDANRIQQVIWNLLSNAIKFTPGGGTVAITLAREGSKARLTVSDTGTGISADFLPYVFDRFRQADSTSRRKFGGLGLGLSIVKQLVELHGGTVEAQSEGTPGKGATFTVTLPIAAVSPLLVGSEDGAGQRSGDSAGASELALGDPPVRLDGLRVVVVDDEADARRVLTRVLQDAGAVVVVAGTVAEALRAVDNIEPHVLVSDIAMPDEDGYDLIRQVRAQGHSVKSLPAVALTAFAAKGYGRTALLAGFQAHAPKPINPDDLIAIVASLAGRRG